MRASRSSSALQHVSLVRGGRRVQLTTADREPLKASPTKFLRRTFGGSEHCGATVVRRRGRRLTPVEKELGEKKKRRIDLVALSVTPQTLRHYEVECLEFEAWARRHRRRLTAHEDADAAMQEYFEKLALEREAPRVGRTCLFGFLLLKMSARAKDRMSMPLSRFSLRGWTRLMPGRVRDPAPIEVAWMIAIYFAERWPDKVLRMVLACAVALQVDSYCRPGAYWRSKARISMDRRPEPARTMQVGAWCCRPALAQAAQTLGSRTRAFDSESLGGIGSATPQPSSRGGPLVGPFSTR